MKAWTRAEWDHRCGACGRHIYPGYLMFITSVAGVVKPFRRCLMCADEAPPMDTPHYLAPAPREAVTDTIGRRGRRPQVDPVDWKSKQSGDA